MFQNNLDSKLSNEENIKPNIAKVSPASPDRSSPKVRPMVLVETGCPKLEIVEFRGVQFFKGYHNISRLQAQTCIYSLKLGIMSIYNVLGNILR